MSRYRECDRCEGMGEHCAFCLEVDGYCECDEGAAIQICDLCDGTGEIYEEEGE